MHCKIRRYLRHGMLIHLKVFDAVVRLGSFTRAGEALHMAQPTVSVHMKKLAEAIGTPLIEHDGKRFRLTPAGEKVHAACEHVFAAFEELDRALAETGAVEIAQVRRALTAPRIPRLRRASCLRGTCRRS